ncbi:mycofactocin system transcriptional regulator [Geodermatophilus ruber]|uniref:Transcriptional regulator, TetR family n=1 Tax=Geodermatophilus ruber TaxID=504800 RepID=A0A1I3ZF64_9ACTN|nr:mycofactocin system transcriptional regulator [Geodermatophilus ruber]SFK42675.1 transcriptional regulator, TetR family [Geodermatophilus ruber]
MEGSDTECHGQHGVYDTPWTRRTVEYSKMSGVTVVVGEGRAETRTRVEQAALDLFGRKGFEQVTTDEIAEAAGISRRTFFRHFATKADPVWGDFASHVARLERLLMATRSDQPVLASICAAYVEVNDYAAADLPMLRQRMRMILGEPALQAHSQVRYADVDRVVAEHVARRTGQPPEALLPRLVATTTRAAATTAFEVWLADGTTTLADDLRAAFDQLADGFPTLRRP